ncbi:MAG TPA: hypothetical protein VNU26_04680, partial [Mycobacteriales bacterium]|nr:hypothetical protein [Mycobacteriales bacterium]
GQGRVTFGITASDGTRPDSRDVLEYGVAPGSQVFDHVSVVNQSDQPLTLRLYGSDGVNASNGGLDVRSRAERNRDLGAWIHLGSEDDPPAVGPSARSSLDVEVPPQSSERGVGNVVVPVRIAVPSDATPGDHVGGIVAALIARGENAQSQNIEFEQRVVLRVYVRVAGALQPRLDLDVLDVAFTGGGGLGFDGAVTVTYRLTNAGNTRIGAASTVGTAGPLGVLERSVDGTDVDELVPGDSVVLTATVPDVPATIRTDVKVSATAVRVAGGRDPGLEPQEARAGIWSVTWQQCAAVLLLALLVAGFRWSRRRARTAPVARHGRSPSGRRALADAST